MGGRAANQRPSPSHHRACSSAHGGYLIDNGIGGGAYVNLDFGDLVAISLLDGRVREAFLGVTMVVEHFAKMKVLSNVEGRGEDGYAIVAGFYASLNHAGRNAIQGAMRVRSRKGDRHDAYAGDLIANHMDDMPVWVYLEVIDFGTFVDFYLFCANRWGDSEMLQEHFALKSVKALRNATAHNHCIINGFTKAEARADYATPQVITDSLNAACVVRTEARRAKLSNLRISQMAAALYCLGSLCTSDSAMARGELIRIVRGVYALPEAWEDEFALAQHRFSHETALCLHGLTDRASGVLTMTFPHGYNTGSARGAGIDARTVKAGLVDLGAMVASTPYGNEVRAYCPERALCDLFRSNPAPDLQLAVPAIRAYLASEARNTVRLMGYAQKMRVEARLRPYVEAIL